MSEYGGLLKTIWIVCLDKILRSLVGREKEENITDTEEAILNMSLKHKVEIVIDQVKKSLHDQGCASLQETFICLCGEACL